ncbi:MAG: hypothetical protein MK111_26335 [Crocosphaera sp.]|uniref:hypothetical protein n=1 Tax=Crocosphaera sp. TaxID=2729996 RepID=UPI002582D5E6|nr:hypothetical protein [Crocosphaera sp.]MCH2248099.1 hypothetical protein [Crocosphaera sp.]
MGLLEEYLGFIRDINGLLGSIINFFPLSAVLFDLIPEFNQTGRLNKVLTSISCIFVIYVSFIFAHLIKKHFEWYKSDGYGFLANIRHILVILFCIIICLSATISIIAGISNLNSIIDCIETSCPYLESIQSSGNYTYSITGITFGFSGFNIMNFVFLYKS